MKIKSLLVTLTMVLYSTISYGVSSVDKALTYPVREIGNKEYLFDKNIDYTVTVLYKENASEKEQAVISKSFIHTNKNKIIEKITKDDVGILKVEKDPYSTQLKRELQFNIISPNDLTAVDKAYLNGDYKESPAVHLSIEKSLYKYAEFLGGDNKATDSFVDLTIRTTTFENDPKMMTIFKYTVIENNKAIDKYVAINSTQFPKKWAYHQNETIKLTDNLKLVLETKIK